MSVVGVGAMSVVCSVFFGAIGSVGVAVVDVQAMRSARIATVFVEAFRGVAAVSVEAIRSVEIVAAWRCSVAVGAIGFVGAWELPGGSKLCPLGNGICWLQRCPSGVVVVFDHWLEQICLLALDRLLLER